MFTLSTYKFSLISAVVIAALTFPVTAHAQHGGGHGGGGHGGGHSYGGHGGGYGGHGSYGGHGGYGGFGHGGYGGHSYGGHSYGGHSYGGHSYGGHGFGYGSHGYGSHGYGGHGYGGHGYGGHGISIGLGHGGYGSHHGIGHYSYGHNNYYPHSLYYSSGYYGITPSYYYGYSPVGAIEYPYYGTSSALLSQPLTAQKGSNHRHQGNRQSNRSAQIKIVPSTAIQTATSTEGKQYQQRAESAFRAGRYNEALKLSNHALVETPRNGNLLLFISQTLFASGDYRGAAATIHQASSILDKKEWGYIVKNWRNYYSGNAYNNAIDKLNNYVKKNPNAADARFLQAYHFGFLNHKEFARKEMIKVIELESRDRLAVELLVMFGGKAPLIKKEHSPPASLEIPPQPKLQPKEAIVGPNLLPIPGKNKTEQKHKTGKPSTDSHDHKHE